jgi:hypothetical protein
VSFRGTRNHTPQLTTAFVIPRNEESHHAPHSSPQRLSFRGTRNHITSITSDRKPRLKAPHNACHSEERGITPHSSPQQLSFRGTRNHTPHLTTTIVIPRNEESHHAHNLLR